MAIALVVAGAGAGALLAGCGPSEARNDAASATDVEAVSVARDVTERRRTPTTSTSPEEAPPRPTTEPDASVWDAAHSEGVEARVAAIERIAVLDRSVAEPALIRITREAPEADVREAALEALDGSESLDVAQAFRDAMADSSLWVQDAAEQGLYRWKDRTVALGAVAELCASDDRALRIRAAELLDEMVPDQLPWDEIAEGPVRFEWAPASPFAGRK